MNAMDRPELTLRVPGKAEYVLVIRMALGGVAVLKDLSVDALDDLRAATDEACDCLLHQGTAVESLTLSAGAQNGRLTVSLTAEIAPGVGDICREQTEISRAILETLIPEVTIETHPCGCVQRIDMMLPCLS